MFELISENWQAAQDHMLSVAWIDMYVGLALVAIISLSTVICLTMSRKHPDLEHYDDAWFIVGVVLLAITLLMYIVVIAQYFLTIYPWSLNPDIELIRSLLRQ